MDDRKSPGSYRIGLYRETTKEEEKVCVVCFCFLYYQTFHYQDAVSV